jgi:hypothetical protein
LGRSGTEETGKFEIDLVELGMMPFTYRDFVGNELKPFKGEKYSIEYKSTATLTEYGPYAYGEIKFTSKSTDISNSRSNLDQFVDPFVMNTTSGTLIGNSTKFYNKDGGKINPADGPVYYISSTLWRFTQNPDNGAHPIDPCENSEQALIVEKNLQR